MSYLTVDGQRASTSSEKAAGDKKESEDLEVDNSKSVLLKIATLYAEQLMSDLVLEVGGTDYPAHRLILCASSEVFQVMLMGREWSEWRESRILLQETPPAARVFPHFLKYFYTGQIKISYQTVLPVLSLADKYNVKDLVSLCLCFMSNHVAVAARRGQLVEWMQYAQACGHNHIAKTCHNFLKWNLSWSLRASLANSEVRSDGESDADSDLSDAHSDVHSAAHLDVATMISLLKESDLVLHNEMELYNLVVEWLQSWRARLAERGAGGDWEALVTAVSAHVRFPMMCPKQLARLLLSPLTQEFKEFFMERMAVAMSYQSGQWSSAASPLLTPRLYTEDPWGAVLCVDNLTALQCYHCRAAMFSTRSALPSHGEQDRLTEWSLELYPKGVWFQKSLLILFGGTFDVPEVVLRTVRIAVTCLNPPAPSAAERDERDEPDIRVKIGILVWGVQKGVEHIATVVQRIHRFSSSNRVLNIDGALDFDELNSPLYSPAPRPASPPAGRARCANCDGRCNAADDPRHLLGPGRDQLRIQVVILPLTDDCCVDDDVLG